MTKVSVHNLGKPKNLYTGQAPRSIKDISKNILLWGENNDYPQELVNTIYRSHTASACLDAYNSFLAGSGFSDKSLHDFMVNSDETLLDLHTAICPDYTYFDGFAVRVMWNPQGKIEWIRHMPFESVRLGIPDENGYVKNIYYNPFYGTCDFNQKYTETYDAFSTDIKVIRQQILDAGLFEWKGQILYVSKKKSMRRFYPEPFYSGALKWFSVDNSIGEFHENNIDNNFLLSCIIKLVGDPEETAEADDEGNPIKTIGEAFDEEITHNLSGKDNGGKMMVLWAKAKEMYPELEAFPANTNDELFKTLQQLVIDNICIGTRVPPIIAGVQVSGKLGNTAEILNSARLLQKTVSTKQEKLEHTYEKLLSLMVKPYTQEIEINRVNNLAGLDPQWASYFSTEEIKKYLSQEYGIELMDTVPDQIPEGTPDQIISNIFSPVNKESKYNRFYELVNMTYKELDTWLNSDCSKKLGLSMEMPKKVLSILALNKGDWTSTHESWANRTINSIERLMEIEDNKMVGDCGGKKNLLLKNLGHNVDKL